jgi:hypothetical protein
MALLLLFSVISYQTGTDHVFRLHRRLAFTLFGATGSARRNATAKHPANFLLKPGRAQSKITISRISD